MEKSTLNMLVTLMFALSACISAAPAQDFDLQKITGKWYTAGMATQADWFVNHKATMKMGTVNVVATTEGDLEITYTYQNADGSCLRSSNLAKKTETAGRFTFTSTVWNNDNDMNFVDVQSDNYALIYTIKTSAEGTDSLVELFTKSPEISEELQQKFQQFSQERGILPENAVIFPKSAECLEA